MSSDASGSCDFCQKPISESDFRSGKAVLLLKKRYCPDCMRNTLEKSKTRRKTVGSRVSPDDLRPSAAPAPRKVALGEHACCLYASESERRAQMLAFVRDGLRNGERVVYALDDAMPGRVLDDLEKDDLDVERLRAKGQLDVRPASELFAPDGRFDARLAVERVRSLVDQSVAEGYPGMRLSSEMTWALRGMPGSEHLTEFEVQVNALFPAVRCATLCQYDVTRFALPHLQHLKASHPVVLGASRS